MASKFLPWIETPTNTNVKDYETFQSDEERGTGFLPNTGAHSSMVNTALRQANLVAVALMRLVDPNGSYDARSSYDNVENVIDLYLRDASKITRNTNSAFNRSFESSSSNYKKDGTASVGSLNTVARADHAHPLNVGSTVSDVKMDGTRSLGTSTSYARVDHVHPTDTSREPAFVKNTAFNKNFSSLVPYMNGISSAGVSNEVSRADHVHPTDTSREPAFIHNTAFNKDFGNAQGTVCEGNDARLSDARTPVAHASTSDVYGIGTRTSYGHVALRGGDMHNTTYVNGVAAGVGHTHSNYSWVWGQGTASTQFMSGSRGETRWWYLNNGDFMPEGTYEILLQLDYKSNQGYANSINTCYSAVVNTNDERVHSTTILGRTIVDATRVDNNYATIKFITVTFETWGAVEGAEDARVKISVTGTTGETSADNTRFRLFWREMR